MGLWVWTGCQTFKPHCNFWIKARVGFHGTRFNFIARIFGAPFPSLFRKGGHYLFWAHGTGAFFWPKLGVIRAILPGSLLNWRRISRDFLGHARILHRLAKGVNSRDLFTRARFRKNFSLRKRARIFFAHIFHRGRCWENNPLFSGPIGNAHFLRGGTSRGNLLWARYIREFFRAQDLKVIFKGPKSPGKNLLIKGGAVRI